MEEYYEHIVVTEDFKEINIGEEGNTFILECKVNKILDNGTIARWYKNGELIQQTERSKIVNDGMWLKLVLNNLTKADEGIYSVIIAFTACELSTIFLTKCILYIKSRNSNHLTYFIKIDEVEPINTKLKLRCYTVSEDVNFQLDAVFPCVDVLTCTWYKNNIQIPSRHPKLFKNINKHAEATLYINKTETTDYGIYSVVALTSKHNYLCSFANVLVEQDVMDEPRVLQMPSYTKVYEKDDVYWVCKLVYERDTNIEWIKDGREINLTDRIICDTSGDQYIALILFDVKVSDSGQYHLILRKNNSAQIAASGSVILSVKEYTSPRPEPCSVIESLKPSIVSIGNGATFRCSFDIPDLKYTYVSWIIGNKRVEKSNKIFKVISNGNNYLLHVSAAIPEMAGKVTCQLRQKLFDEKSILIAKTECYLVVAPPQVIEEGKIGGFVNTECNIYSQNVRITIQNSIIPAQNTTFIMLCLQFAVISDVGIFFEISDKVTPVAINVIRVYKKEPDPNAEFSTLGDWTIHWTGPTHRMWYAIDLCQPNGLYKQIGVSTATSFDIKEPPLDKLFRFRIRCVKPKKKKKKPVFRFVPEEVTRRKSMASRKICQHLKFKKLYVNYEKIGRGTFGVIHIVRRRDGQFFTSVTTKCVLQSKRERAIREYSILKKLSHPQTIALIDGFHTKNGKGLTIVTELLWGDLLEEHPNDNNPMYEVDVITYVRQILRALEYIHSKKIAHLDLKPESICFVNPNSRIIKLIDFCMARIVVPPIILPATYGPYLPPEMIHGELVGTYSDMWSLGVLTYYLLLGSTLPFAGLNRVKRNRNISNVNYSYDDAYSTLISDRAKIFVSNLLRRQPDDRYSAIAALNDDWITKGPEEGLPKKVQIRNNGVLVFVNILQWRILTLVLVAVTRFRAGRCRRLNLGRQIKRERVL